MTAVINLERKGNQRDGRQDRLTQRENMKDEGIFSDVFRAVGVECQMLDMVPSCFEKGNAMQLMDKPFSTHEAAQLFLNPAAVHSHQHFQPFLPETFLLILEQEGTFLTTLPVNLDSLFKRRFLRENVLCWWERKRKRFQRARVVINSRRDATADVQLGKRTSSNLN